MYNCILFITVGNYLFIFIDLKRNFYSSRKKSSRQVRKAHQHSINLPLPTAQITINPQDIEPDQQQQHSVVIPSPYDDSHLISTPMSMHRTPFMASSRSITSACTGLSFVGNDTPRSMRYTPAHKISTTAAIESTAGIFSDSETSRTRIRRPTRSPIFTQQSSYSTSTDLCNNENKTTRSNGSLSTIEKDLR